MWLFLFFLAVFFLMPENAYAGYLDPGSGSTIVQGTIATIAAIKSTCSKSKLPLLFFVLGLLLLFCAAIGIVRDLCLVAGSFCIAAVIGYIVYAIQKKKE